MAEPKVGLSTVHYQSLLCFPGGIIQHHCSAGSLDHAVQIVGYDTTGAVQYVYSKLCKGTVTWTGPWNIYSTQFNSISVAWLKVVHLNSYSKIPWTPQGT